MHLECLEIPMTLQGCGIVLFLVTGMAGRNRRKRHEDCIFANQMVRQLTKEDLHYKMGRNNEAVY